jgi:hypothetical protein
LTALDNSSETANILVLQNRQASNAVDISLSICSSDRQCILIYSSSCELKRVRVLRLSEYGKCFKEWEYTMQQRIWSLCQNMNSIIELDDICQSIQQLLLQG